MSSIAFQPSTSVASHHQQYPTTSRDQYHSQQHSQQSLSSPSTSRKTTTRSATSNGASDSVAPSSSTMSTPRALPTPYQASPTGSPALNAPSVPPRTSSHRMPTTTVTASPKFDTSGSNQNIQNIKSPQQISTNDAYSESHNRKRAAQNARDQQVSTASATRPDLVHEDSASSAILNRLVISDPSEDVLRDQTRVAESRPLPQASSTSNGESQAPSAGPTSNLVNPDAGDERASQHTRQGSRQDAGSQKRKEVKFGEYILGQTLGEGEFGKVKMGWKRDGSTQVAIKLIRRETLGSNPNRLPKIYREIAILRELEHPNIVRLHEMVETERHIGIILEYASGGELFDYILQHRYLKDGAARRLFAQLISGVGYLHKKGIVHRDLKLENLLLDRNRNIIITDFGFANTFNSADELTEEVEYGLGNKDFVKRLGLDHTDDLGHRRGDLMQTSCGSPCYAAPELVVTDSLYTGRKVDVWSCGVILYAMLAGYLPFDDDPANPEGDNINLLYKYIVSTPLIFPEYVTPHARDLLKRILVPDPRKRADLFELARHSWLSEYAHVVGFITSSTSTTKDIANATVPPSSYEVPHLARSASVREPTTKSNTSRQATHVPGGLTPRTGHIDPMGDAERAKAARDNKRRTVQVEYVAPQSQISQHGAGGSINHSRTPAQNPNDVPVEPEQYKQASAAVPSVTMASPVRPAREDYRAASDNLITKPTQSGNRPSTGGSMTGRLPSRSSYGQPAVAVVKEQAQGRISQPRLASHNHDERRANRHSYVEPSNSNGAQIGFPQTFVASVPGSHPKKAQGHKRSNTLGGIGEKLGFGKRGSIFSSRGEEEKDARRVKKYPPVSMSRPIPNDNAVATAGTVTEPRKSVESRRTSFSLGKRPKEGSAQADQGQNAPGNRSSRRFSFIPSFGRRDTSSDGSHTTHATHRTDQRPRIAFGRGESRSSSQSTNDASIMPLYDSAIDGQRGISRKPVPAPKVATSPPQNYPNYPTLRTYAAEQDSYTEPEERYAPLTASSTQEQQHNTFPGTDYDEPEIEQTSHQQRQYHHHQQQQQQQQAATTPTPLHGVLPTRPSSKPSVLHKRRNFNEAYEQEGGHSGSSGAAKKVMALFTFRRKARSGQ